jgi:hypothetical protein
MRAAIIVLMLTFATQAGAECGNLCNPYWWKTATTADLQDQLAARRCHSANSEWRHTTAQGWLV